MIPGFNSSLQSNFNHLMYADDLILISFATKKVACNMNKCLAIYYRITRQKANNLKSAILFSDRFTPRLMKGILNIIAFKIGSFPFTYIGVLISTKKLAIFHFDSMIDRVE